MKTIEQILREQVYELEKLLKLKELRIVELEVLRSVPNIISPFKQESTQQRVDHISTVICFKCLKNNCTCDK